MIVATLLAAAFAAVRIVSLAPSLTEDLYAIGAGADVVGVDAYSNRPAAARRLPRVGSMRTINSEVIAGLNPDLVVGIPYQLPSLQDLSRTGIRTQSLASDTLADDLSTIAALGVLTGHVDGATHVLATIRRRLALASRFTRSLPQPRAFAVIGVTPIYTAGAGSYIDDLMVSAHIRNIARNVHSAFPALSAETLEAADPDVLIVPRGTSIPDVPPWSRLRAVRRHRIVIIEEDDLLRPGPRVADVVDALIRCIAPFRPHHTGSEKLSALSESQGVRLTVRYAHVDRHSYSDSLLGDRRSMPAARSNPPVPPNTSLLFGHEATASLSHRASIRRNIRARSGHRGFFRTLLGELGPDRTRCNRVADRFGLRLDQVSSIRNQLVKKDVVYAPNGGMIEFRIPLTDRTFTTIARKYKPAPTFDQSISTNGRKIAFARGRK